MRIRGKTLTWSMRSRCHKTDDKSRPIFKRNLHVGPQEAGGAARRRRSLCREEPGATGAAVKGPSQVRSGGRARNSRATLEELTEVSERAPSAQSPQRLQLRHERPGDAAMGPRGECGKCRNLGCSARPVHIRRLEPDTVPAARTLCGHGPGLGSQRLKKN